MGSFLRKTALDPRDCLSGWHKRCQDSVQRSAFLYTALPSQNSQLVTPPFFNKDRAGPTDKVKPENISCPRNISP
jgi:hypothetical protein